MLLEISKSILYSILFMPIAKVVGLYASSLKRNELKDRSSQNIYRTGGLLIFFGTIIYWITNKDIFSISQNYLPYPNLYLTIIISSSFIFIVGFIDDLKNLSPLTRLILQIIIASFVFSQGIRFEIENMAFINFININSYLESFLNLLITIFWIVGLINAINWIDGLDGLASGFTIISLISLINIGRFYDINIEVFVIPIIGSCIGFLIFNFFPAKIYMGDGGSYFLGFNLAIWTIISTNSSPLTFQNPSQVSGIIVSFIIMFMPIFDMMCLIIRRSITGASPFFPDNKHFHHLIIECGFTHKNAVIYYFFIFQWFANLAYAITIKSIFNINFIISSISLLLISILNFNKIRKLPSIIKQI